MAQEFVLISSFLQNGKVFRLFYRNMQENIKTLPSFTNDIVRMFTDGHHMFILHMNHPSEYIEDVLLKVISGM